MHVQYRCFIYCADTCPHVYACGYFGHSNELNHVIHYKLEKNIIDDVVNFVCFLCNGHLVTLIFLIMIKVVRTVADKQKEKVDLA